MDRGDNAKAALVLEQELASRPENTEAHELLASAYVGLAGVDVYSIQEAFQDVLFRRSLKDEFQGNGGIAPSTPSAPTRSVPPSDDVNGERAIRNLDRALVDVQKIVLYLARFPQIPEEKWVYLEKALAELEGSKRTSDIAIYRILIRLIYVKSYLVQATIRDDEFGTKQWACTFEPSSLKDGLEFVNDHIRHMRDDVVLAVRKGAKKFAKADGVLTSVINATDLTASILVLESSRTVQEGEARLRIALGCTYTR